METAVRNDLMFDTLIGVNYPDIWGLGKQLQHKKLVNLARTHNIAKVNYKVDSDVSDTSADNNSNAGTEEAEKPDVHCGDIEEGKDMGDAEEEKDRGDAEEKDRGDAEEEKDRGDAEDEKDRGDAEEEKDRGDAEEEKDRGDAEEEKDRGDAEEEKDRGDAEEGKDTGDAEEGKDTGDAEEEKDRGDAEEEKDRGDAEEGKDTGDAEEEKDRGDVEEDDREYDIGPPVKKLRRSQKRLEAANFLKQQESRSSADNQEAFRKGQSQDLSSQEAWAKAEQEDDKFFIED